MNNASRHADELRRRAEARLAAQPAAVVAPAGAEAQRLLHELRVHQVELEMQNEELQQAQGALQEALREAESRYQLLSDLASDCVLWISPGGEILYASPSCHLVLGRTPADFVADPDLLQTIIHPEDRVAFRDHVTQEGDANPHQHEFRILHSRAGERWIEHYCEPVRDSTGRLLGRRSSNRDITRRKEDERQLHQQARELKRSNAELSGFNRLMVGRELDMVELKKQVNALCRELGKTPPYPVGFPASDVDIYQYSSGGKP